MSARQVVLSVVVPCYNEERTLERGIQRLRAIADAQVARQIIVVDDGSKDRSVAIAQRL